jgi:hypothetical protein
LAPTHTQTTLAVGWEAVRGQRHGLEVLHDGAEMELVAGVRKTSQPNALEAVMNL